MSQYHSINAGETERFFTVVARASGAPITSGTVNYYLRAKSGAEAEKYWADSTETWEVAETANAMTHDADGHWEIDLTSSPFADAIRYLEYVKESGDLHVPQARHLIGKAVVEAANATQFAGQDITCDAPVTINPSVGAATIQPTNAQLEARTLVAAEYGTAANQVTIAGYIDTEVGAIVTHLTEIKGATWNAATDSLEAIRDRGDSAWITATGFSTHSAGDVLTAFGTGSALTALAPAATALTSVVWTNTKAGYLDQAISGVSGLDAAGVRAAIGMAAADLDTQLDAIAADAATAAGASGGSGARTVAITTNDGTTALESARVRVTKGAETYVQTSNASGLATFNLDDGTWTVAVSLAGYTYSGTSLVVNGDETVTYSMTAASFTPSTLPDTVTVRWTAIDSADFQAVGASEATIYMRIKTPPTTDGFAWDKGERTATSDANGVIQFTDVPLGCVVRVRLGATGAWNDVEIPSDATSPYDAGEFVGVV